MDFLEIMFLLGLTPIEGSRFIGYAGVSKISTEPISVEQKETKHQAIIIGNLLERPLTGFQDDHGLVILSHCGAY